MRRNGYVLHSWICRVMFLFAAKYRKSHKIASLLECVLSLKMHRPQNRDRCWGPLSRQLWISVCSQQGLQLGL